MNPTQLAMHADFDHDGIVNGEDDCPTVANATQQPSSVKGIGKACIGLIKERDLEVTTKVTGKPRRGKTLHLRISVRNTYPLPASGDIVSVKVPRGLTLKSAHASAGKYRKGRWTLAHIAADKTVTLILTVKVKGKLPTTLTAELIKAGQKDPNSTPNNHNIYEDDESRRVIR